MLPHRPDRFELVRSLGEGGMGEVAPGIPMALPISTITNETSPPGACQ